MSAAYYIVLDNNDPGFDPFANGKFLSKESDVLAAISELAEQPTLDDFVSLAPDESAAMMEELGGDAGDVEFPPERWFSADEGIGWAKAILAEVEKKRSSLKNADGVISDLREYEQVLSQAKAIGAKWHLQVDL